jgi:PRTRC genetic system ThiF family protein
VIPTKSYRIETGEIARYTVLLVGCGGTGSFVALHLARLAWSAPRLNLRLIFIDPDVVELRNAGRQNFAPAEVGQFKAVALARRYSHAFGLKIEARAEAFRAAWVSDSTYRYQDDVLTLLVGCVDNPAARREMAKVNGHRRVWWLDSGNWLDGGNIFIGNSDRTLIDPTGFAIETPRPSVQEPGLLDNEPAPAETPTARTQAEAPPASCAELLAAETQSLMINQAMAGWVATYASRLILSRDLDIMATYVNLAAGSVRSVAITGEVGRIEVVKEEEPAGRVYTLDWDAGELLEIRDGHCPECGAALVNGRDTVDEEETDIIFCANCHWIMTTDDLAQRLEVEAETEEDTRRMEPVR